MSSSGSRVVHHTASGRVRSRVQNFGTRRSIENIQCAAELVSCAGTWVGFSRVRVRVPIWVPAGNPWVPVPAYTRRVWIGYTAVISLYKIYFYSLLQYAYTIKRKKKATAQPIMLFGPAMCLFPHSSRHHVRWPPIGWCCAALRY
jgi:hypothetical protein